MLSRRDTPRSAAYAALVIGTLGIALIGYLGYVVYPRFDLPPGRGALLLALAAGAGVASFFSPCSFALLVTMLAHPPTGGSRGPSRSKLRESLRLAAALSVGAATFLLLVGAAMGMGAHAVFGDIRFDTTLGRIIRAVSGDLLIILGLIQLGVIPLSLRGFEPATHRFLDGQSGMLADRSMIRGGLFGFCYLVAGFG